MSSFEDLDGLRRQNKELLQKLRHKTDNLQGLHLDCLVKPAESVSDVRKSEKRSARDHLTSLTERNESLLNVSEDFINLNVGGNSPKMARSALCKQINITKTPKLAVASGCLTGESFLQDRGNIRPHVQANPSGTLEAESVKSQRVVSHVRFPADHELELASESERRHVQPLLGYDWIAGLLDAESSLTERSENFFSELHTFRHVNKEECVHSAPSWLPVAADLWSPCAEDDVTKHECVSDAHQCTFCYRINSRLFATPLSPQTTCPVCKMPKEKHPQTEHEPACIRVSIPRSTLLPTYQYKAHRRCSFDPSDSLGLPSHCLSGWTNSSMGAGSKMSSLDLRSSMEIRPHPGRVSSVQDENQLDLIGSRASECQRSGRLLDVSRLARYRFQHNTTTRTKPFDRLCQRPALCTHSPTE